MGVCTCLFGAGGRVGVYLQQCEPNSGCKNFKQIKIKSKSKVSTVWDEHDHDENVLRESNTNQIKTNKPSNIR